MKRSTKIALWAFLASFLLGIGLACVALAQGASPYLEISRDGIRVPEAGETFTGELPVSAYTQLSITAERADVILIPSDHHAVTYQVSFREEIPVAQQQGQQLSIRQAGYPGFLIQLGLFQAPKKNEIRVYYDASKPLDSVEAQLASGDFLAQQVEARQLHISLDCGDLTLACQAEDVKIQVKVGNVKLEDCRIERLQSQLDCGDMQASGIVNQAAVQLDLGNFRFTNGELSNLDYQGRCGDCSVQGKLTGNSRFTLDLGNLSLDTSLAQDQYRLDLACEAGDMRVNGEPVQRIETETGSHGLQARVSSGDMQMNFS